MKVPVSLIIDDAAPVLSVFYAHAKGATTKDGRALIPTYPNSLLSEFCDVVEKRGIKGKFTIVPMPGNMGDMVNGLQGVSKKELDEWISIVKERLLPAFTVGPEMLTHHKAVNLEDGSSLALDEDDWAALQDRNTLTPYIAKALSLLKEAGFDSIGVTSPWQFGIKVEKEYEAAISKAVYEVTGSNVAWFFLRSLRGGVPNAKPWVALDADGRTLVSIPATTHDRIWQTIDTTDTSDEFVCSIADQLITADGKSGEIIQVLETGGYPILITHWQSLMSNGLATGIRVLDEICRRVNEHLSDRVEWMSFEEIMNLVLENKENYPKPEFKK